MLLKACQHTHTHQLSAQLDWLLADAQTDQCSRAREVSALLKSVHNATSVRHRTPLGRTPRCSFMASGASHHEKAAPPAQLRTVPQHTLSVRVRERTRATRVVSRLRCMPHLPPPPPSPLRGTRARPNSSTGEGERGLSGISPSAVRQDHTHTHAHTPHRGEVNAAVAALSIRETLTSSYNHIL